MLALRNEFMDGGEEAVQEYVNLRANVSVLLLAHLLGCRMRCRGSALVGVRCAEGLLESEKQGRSATRVMSYDTLPSLCFFIHSHSLPFCPTHRESVRACQRSGLKSSSPSFQTAGLKIPTNAQTLDACTAGA